MEIIVAVWELYKWVWMSFMWNDKITAVLALVFIVLSPWGIPGAWYPKVLDPRPWDKKINRWPRRILFWTISVAVLVPTSFFVIEIAAAYIAFNIGKLIGETTPPVQLGFLIAYSGVVILVLKSFWTARRLIHDNQYQASTM